MAESYVNVTEGSGKKLHTFNRTIDSQSVEDEVVILGEHYMATRRVGAVVPVGTAQVVLQIMAGATKKLRIRSVEVIQHTAATTAGTLLMLVRNATTAGTGGTTQTVTQYDTGDTSAESTAMSIPTVPPTTGSGIYLSPVLSLAQTSPFGALGQYRWSAREAGVKPIIVQAGTSNGIAFVVSTAVTGAQVLIQVIYDESDF